MVLGYFCFSVYLGDRLLKYIVRLYVSMDIGPIAFFEIFFIFDRIGFFGFRQIFDIPLKKSFEVH